MCVGIIFTYYFYVGGRALPGLRLELNPKPAEHSTRHAPSGLARNCNLHDYLSAAGNGVISKKWQSED